MTSRQPWRRRSRSPSGAPDSAGVAGGALGAASAAGSAGVGADAAATAGSVGRVRGLVHDRRGRSRRRGCGLRPGRRGRFRGWCRSGWASDGLGGGRRRRDRRVEEHELELEPETAGAEPGRIDRAETTGGGDQRGVVRAAIGEAREQALPDRVHDLVEEDPEVPAPILEPVEERDPRHGITRRHGRHEAVDRLGVGQAEELADRLGLDASGGGGEQLVQDRLRIAHPAGGEPRDERHRLGLGVAAVGRQDPLELAGDLGDGQAPDVEPLQARQDRRGELLRVRRREHEGDELGRLLERLEERVPGVLRDLVRLVEDVDLAAQVRRGVGEALAQLAHGLDATVGRGVDLDEVEGTALADRDARGTAITGVGVGLEVRAVDGLGQDPGERGLAGAARAREQDRVRDTPGRHGVAQRGDHRLLADDLRERLGPPATVERLVRNLCGQRRSWAGVSRLVFAVHPPSIRTLPCPPTIATRTRPFRGTRRSPLSAASFRT